MNNCRYGDERSDRGASANPCPSAPSTPTPIASFNPSLDSLGACQREQRDPDKNRASKCFEASDTCGRRGDEDVR